MEALISPNEKVYDYAGALIGERVAEVCPVAFDVSPPLFWVPCSDDTNPSLSYYDPSSETILLIPPSPYVIASFAPNPVLAGQETTLTWEAFNGTSVMLGSYGSEQFPLSGSKPYTYSGSGTQSELVTVVASRGNVQRPISVRVVATVGEMSSSGNAPITVL